MMKKKYLFLVIFILLIFILFLIRISSKKEIDDVSPEIFCEKDYMQKSDILWIIPIFDDKPIHKNESWCEYILSLNKTLGLHGIKHSFEEFDKELNEEYIKEGIEIFEKCFGFKPEIFKPPQLKISSKNKKLIKKYNMKIKGNFNQIIHKVYHCDDSGLIKNNLINLF
jgi:predicted deacetylase